MKIDMKQVFADAQARTLQLSPPPIPFEETSKGKTLKDGKATEEEEDPTKSVSVDLKLNPDDKDSELMKRKVSVFKEGTPEDYCKWRVDFNDLIEHPTFQSPVAQANILKTILKGKAKDTFVSSYDSYKGYLSESLEDIYDDSVE